MKHFPDQGYPGEFKYSTLESPGDRMLLGGVTIRSRSIPYCAVTTEHSVPLTCRSSIGGSLGLLGRGAEAGPRPVVPVFRVDGSESQVDPWASIVVLFGHLMLPIILRGTFHY